MHLSEEQLDDLLIGEVSPEVEAHLAGCAVCRERLQEAEAPLASFREMSLAWAERRSVTMAAPRPEAQSGRVEHRFSWAMVMTGTLALAVAIPMLHHTRASAPQEEPALGALASTGHTSALGPASGLSSSQVQIAEDNAMLAEIDRALQQSDAPAASYGLESQSHHAESARNRTENN
ncbi:MAG: hypothetical protein PW735_04540 [Acidobacteriaceae bacterium]|nr:hypothetical protein [Acidobacteriaceae bacterium]